MFKTCKKPPMSIISVSGSICTFNALQEGLPLKSHTVDIDSVSGVNEINIGTVGKNWLNNPDQTITSPSYVINNVNAPMVANHYVLSFDFLGTNNSSSLRVDDENGTAIFVTGKNTINGHNEYLINLPSNGSFVKFFTNAVGTYSNFQIELGNQFTTYEAYKGNTYTTIQIGSTVNKGEYDARTGILEVTSPTVQTIQLPPCPIDTLEGVNNIFADCGSTTLEAIKFGR